MKKQIGLVAVIAMALSACTSTPYQASVNEPRFPANSSNSVGNMVDASAAVSMNSVRWSAEGVKVASMSTSTLANSASNLAVAGVGVSKDVATIVFTTSKSAVSASKDISSQASKFVVTSAGKAFETSVQGAESAMNASKSALQVSVTLAKEAFGTSKTVSLNVFDSVKGFAIGSVEVSGQFADWALAGIKAGSKFAINASGTLVTSSGQIIGQVVDSSSKTVSFVVDSTGKFFVGASNTSVTVVTSSANTAIDFASQIWNGFKGSVNSASAMTVEVAKASSNASAVILTASGKSLMAVSDSAGATVHQEQY